MLELLILLVLNVCIVAELGDYDLDKHKADYLETIEFFKICVSD